MLIGPTVVAVTSQQRHVSAEIRVAVDQPADIVFAIAIAGGFELGVEELSMSVSGQAVDFHEIQSSARTRLHRAPALPVGELVVNYRASLTDGPLPAPCAEPDEVLYVRPSRYCDSDRLANIAFSHFKGLSGMELVTSVRDWVNKNIRYTMGSSRVVDGALDTYLSRRGVCRDMAHLVITFLRAMGMPARLAAVYAPGLTPMDFHAVAEVLVEGRWIVVDPTGLAPRASMVRISTGRDASDTAFMTTMSGRTRFSSMTVTAVVEGELVAEDPHQVVELS